MRKFTQSKNFIKAVNKLGESKFFELQKLIKKILDNPQIGKPMRYQRKGTRELYFNPFRLSYFYDLYKDSLTFLGLYHKKKQ